MLRYACVYSICMMVVILLPASLQAFRNGVIFQSFKKADKGFALGYGLFAFENGHEHIDALLGKGIGHFSCSASV